MLNLLGFNSVVNRWINIATERDDLVNTFVVSNLILDLTCRYGRDIPYTCFVVTEFCAEDLLCYEVEF